MFSRLSHLCPVIYFLHGTWNDLLKTPGRLCHPRLKDSKALTMKVHSPLWFPSCCLNLQPHPEPLAPLFTALLPQITILLSLLLTSVIFSMVFLSLQCSPFHSSLGYFLWILQISVPFPDLGKVGPPCCYSLSQYTQHNGKRSYGKAAIFLDGIYHSL